MRCLEGAEIERYAAGTMDPRAVDEATSHLTECKRCRSAVAEARARLAEESERADKAMVKALCPSCNARYGIPEDRVKGKVLKIRCKSCGGIIEVRGVASAPGGGAPRSVLDRGRRLWFLVVRRERVGPITEQEVRERFSRGEVKPRTYGWRQGFARWERLYNIPEFKDLAAEGQVAPPPPEAAPDARVRRPITRPLPELISEDQDRTERAKRGAAANPLRPLVQSTEELDFDARRPVDTLAKTPVRMDAAAEANVAAIRTHYHAPPEITPELRPGFRTEEALPETAPREPGSAGASQLTHVHFKERDPLEDLPDVLDQAASLEDSNASRTSVIPQRAMEEPEQKRALAAGEFDRHLRGQRNEDSVLFSLGHLRKVAHAALPPRPVAAGPVSTGMTGLFNIKPVAARPAPLMIPVEEPPRAPRGVGFTVGVLTLGALLGAGALFGGLYLARPALVLSLLGRSPTPAKPVRTISVATPTAAGAVKADALRLAAAAPAADAGVAPTKAEPGALEKKAPAVEEKKAPEVAPKVEVKVEAKPVAKAEKKPVARAKPRARKRGSKGVAVVDPGEEPDLDSKPAAKKPEAKKPEVEKDPPEPKVEKKPEKKPDKKKTSTTEELDKLIDAASEGKVPAKKAEPKEEKKPDGEAKAPGLSRDQVASGMRRAAGVVQECNDKFKQSGMVTLEVTIDGGSGRIGRGKVVGGFAGTALGECVLSGVKRAAQFPKFGGQITIQYPFMLK